MSNKKKICIIQFTRAGDIIQSLQSLIGLDKSELSFTLIAREKFAKPLEDILKEVFDEIIYFESKKIFTGFEYQNVSQRLTDFVNEVNANNFDLVVNLSFSPSSAYLCSLINAEDRFGTHYDLRNNLAIQDKWSQFIYSNVLTGAHNTFSLVDLFSLIIGNTAKKTSTPKEQNIQKILIHPFASTSKKKWKTSRWSELIHLLLEDSKGIEIFLCGSDEEIEKSKEIIDSPLLFKYKNRIQNLCGQTTISELNQRLNQIDLFIGHDSMVGHLASLKSIKCITISLGTVRPEESSPYGERNLVFSPKRNCFPCNPETPCEKFECHLDVPYKIIGKFVNELIINPTADYKSIVEVLPKTLYYNSCHIYESYLSDKNFYRIQEISYSPVTIEQVMKSVSRIAWLFFNEETEEKNTLPFVEKETLKDIELYLSGVSHLYELCEFGKKYSKYILEELSKGQPNTDVLKNYSSKLDEVEQLQKALKKVYPAISPLIDFFILARGNILGDNLVELTTNTFFLYNDASLMCSIYFELLEKIKLQKSEEKSELPAERN